MGIVRAAASFARCTWPIVVSPLSRLAARPSPFCVALVFYMSFIAQLWLIRFCCALVCVRVGVECHWCRCRAHSDAAKKTEPSTWHWRRTLEHPDRSATHTQKRNTREHSASQWINTTKANAKQAQFCVRARWQMAKPGEINRIGFFYQVREESKSEFSFIYYLLISSIGFSWSLSYSQWGLDTRNVLVFSWLSGACVHAFITWNIYPRSMACTSTTTKTHCCYNMIAWRVRWLWIAHLANTPRV